MEEEQEQGQGLARGEVLVPREGWVLEEQQRGQQQQRIWQDAWQSCGIVPEQLISWRVCSEQNGAGVGAWSQCNACEADALIP